MPVPFDGTELRDNIMGAIADQIRAMDPGAFADLVPELTEIAEVATRYVLAAQAGDPNAQGILKILGDRALVLNATLAGRGQEALGNVLNAVTMVLAKFAAAMIVGMA